MFGIGTQEILLILVVVLLLFGGKRLPEIARTLGKGIGDFRRAVREVQSDFDLESLGQDPPPSTPRSLPRQPVSKEPKQPSPKISMQASGPPPKPVETPSRRQETADDKRAEAEKVDSGANVTNSKATDTKAADTKVTDAKAADTKATDAKAADSKAANAQNG